jgi:hypothetical protein
MAMACPVTTKWKVVGNVDTAPWVWVLVAVVVVVLIVVLLLVGGRRRKAMQEKRDQEHREKAAEIRREAQNMEIDAREREAKAIRARADAEQAQVDAARLRQEAEKRSQEAQSLRGDVASHARKADELDPDVGTDGSGRDRRVEHDGQVARRAEHDGGPVRDQAAGRDGHGPDLAGRDRDAYRNDAVPASDPAGRGDMNVEGVGAGRGSDLQDDSLADVDRAGAPGAEPGRRREARAADASVPQDVREEEDRRTGI